MCLPLRCRVLGQVTMMVMVYKLIRIASALILGLAAVAGGTSQAAAAQKLPPCQFGHLDFLHDTIPYTTAVAGHGTTDPASHRHWWYMPTTTQQPVHTREWAAAPTSRHDTYGQGAFDTDDVGTGSGSLPGPLPRLR